MAIYMHIYILELSLLHTVATIPGFAVKLEKGEDWNFLYKAMGIDLSLSFGSSTSMISIEACLGIGMFFRTSFFCMVSF